MGSIFEGLASLFGGGKKVPDVIAQPAATYAPPPEATGKTLTDTEADRMKNAVQKKRVGTKALQIPLAGAGTTVNTPSAGVNTGGTV